MTSIKENYQAIETSAAVIGRIVETMITEAEKDSYEIPDSCKRFASLIVRDLDNLQARAIKTLDPWYIPFEEFAKTRATAKALVLVGMDGDRETFSELCYVLQDTVSALSMALVFAANEACRDEAS